MKTQLVRCAAFVAGLVLCAAAQDLVPAFGGAKPPFLLLFACSTGLLGACAAGLAFDALAGLPTGAATLFFLLGSVRFGAHGTAVLPAAFLFPLWLALWGAAPEAGLVAPFASLVWALPLVWTQRLLGPYARLHIGLTEAKGGAA